MADKPKVHWEPTEKQKEALLSPADEILFGGARGGGKTAGGMAWLLYNAHNPRFRALVIRLNSTDLTDWVSRAKHMYAPTGAKFTANPAQIVFPSGATVVLGHLKDENAFQKYQGHEYHAILIEELTQIPSESSYIKLFSSCRSSVPGLKAQMFCTANPGGPGHRWVKLRWNITGAPTKSTIYLDPVSKKSRAFIPARIDDNAYLMENDPTYVSFLDSLPDGLREAWREGSWDEQDIKGAYYARSVDQLIREQRISSASPYTQHNPNLPVFTVWDLGINDNTAIGFFQRPSPSQTVLIDYYEASSEGIDHYIQHLKSKPYIYADHFAPHDIEVREMSTGKTRRESAAALGIDFTPTPKLSINDGINAARLMFSHLYIHERNCATFIEAIRNYRREWDEMNQTFKDKPVHDWTSHAADMFRYAAVMEGRMINPQDYDPDEDNELNMYRPLYSEINI